MVVDTSALIAIFQLEPEWQVLNIAIGSARAVRMSAVNYVECATVVASRHGPRGEAWFDNFISEGLIQITQIDAENALIARRAYKLFGKGFHPAKLNLSDCFAYALAKQTGEPLLFKGNDFSKTDVTPAL